ncbi:hypothetical protein MH1LPH_19890 [Lactiplantibacillus brownii]
MRCANLFDLVSAKLPKKKLNKIGAVSDMETNITAKFACGMVAANVSIVV